MTYPTAIPSYGDTTGNQTLATAGGIGLSAILDLYGVDITAVATKIGTGASTPTANAFLVGNGTGTSAWSTQPVLLDNQKLFFGTGSDASISYDGTNLIIDPKEVGSGGVYIPGVVYISGDNGDITLSANTDGGEYNFGVNTTGTLAFYGAAGATLNLKLLDGTLSTDTIAEATAANGVKIDEVKILDSTIKPDSASTNVDLALQGKGTGNVTVNGTRIFYGSDHVVSGCLWTGDAYASTRVASMTSGVVIIGGTPVVVSAVTSRTFTASRDTYVSVDNTGALTYSEVTNAASSPSLPANSIWLAIVVTGASNIASAYSINLGAISDNTSRMYLPLWMTSPSSGTITDSNGNRIRPTDPRGQLMAAASRNGSATTGAPGGTSVSFNGMNWLVFQAEANTNYELTVMESVISGFSGSGAWILEFYLATAANTYTTRLGEHTSYFAAAARGVDVTFPFSTGSYSGKTYLNIKLRSDGWSGTATVNGDTIRTGIYKLEKI